MGDRISISFVNGNDQSVALFSHWGGREFLNDALAYVRNLRQEKAKGNGSNPLDRLEPQTAMVDFIRHITRNEVRVDRDLYLGKDGCHGDNSDNGHWNINLKTGEFIA